MAKKINASNELNDLIKTTVNLAYKEGLTITELNQLITEQRIKIGMVQKKHEAKYYRDATNEELLFKSKAYMFLTEYISLDDISFELSFGSRQHETISKSLHEYHLKRFSETLFAANILLNDNQPISTPSIADILWKSNNYTSYSDLLMMIRSSSELLKNIEYHRKPYNYYSSSKVLVYYLELIKKNIQ